MQVGREIKFRAWMKHKNKMDFNIVLSPDGRVCDMHHGEICGTYSHENAIVMQFTGLCDKNGKEIYEGDLILSETYGYPIAIYWHDGDAGFYCHDHKGDEDDHLSMAEALSSEVIGNIYENLELLQAI